MTDWQPIETAPKDGTVIDLWAKCWNYETDTFISQRFTDFHWNGFRFIGRVRKDGSSESLNYWHPTHWTPLPEPPTE